MLNLSERLAALPRDGRDALFLLVVIGWVILPHAGRLPWWCSLLAAAVLAWRGSLAWRSHPLPGRWWIVGLLALTLGATWLTHRTLLGRDAGVTLIVVLLALKTLELRARRDAFVVFFLGFFTMLTHFFFSQSLPVAAAMLVGLLGLLTALVNAHMPVGRPPLADAARVAGRMALLGAPVMAVLFVLFPRFAPLWGLPGDAFAGRSGLSSQMSVGSMAALALDDSVAFRVRFDGAPPAQSDLYYRGPVLSVFDGREWRPLGGYGARFSPAPRPTALTALSPPVRYQVTLEPSNRPWLLVLDAAVAAPSAPGLETVVTSELEWFATRPVTELLRYAAESSVQYRYGPATRAGVLEEYTQLPAGRDPRTVQWARGLARSAATPESLVRAVLERLRTGGYQYTLEPGVYGDDTADEFWFGRKQGFCEHIASAFVVAMRAAGIPARIVTGYQGGQLNAMDGFWVVRQSDAHAWAEVWLQGRGWTRVDPTGAVAPGRTGSFERLQPPRGVLADAMDTMSPTLAARLRDAWEAMNNGWNQWILNYTQGRQLDLLRNLGFRSPSWEDLSYLLLALLVAVALAGALWSWWERQQHDPWVRLLARARKRLRASGVEAGPATPPRELSALVTRRFGAAGNPVAQWLLQLEAQRYARAPALALADLQREFRKLPWPSS